MLAPPETRSGTPGSLGARDSALPLHPLPTYLSMSVGAEHIVWAATTLAERVQERAESPRWAEEPTLGKLQCRGVE